MGEVLLSMRAKAAADRSSYVRAMEVRQSKSPGKLTAKSRLAVQNRRAKLEER